MRESWVPYSAAAMASGAVALVLAALSLPSSPDGYQLLQNAQLQDGRWLMGSAGYFLCSVGLVLGLPIFLYVVPRRGRGAALAGIGVFGIATMGMASYGALLLFFQTLVKQGVIGEAEVELLTRDGALIAFAVVFLGSFYVGEVLLAIALLRARTVHIWVPIVFLVHAALLPLNAVAPRLQMVQTILIGIAFMGLAVYANERAQAARTRV